jgi:TatD DNase family protein
VDLVDSHCHLDFEPLAERQQEVLENARRHDVAAMLCISVNLEDFPRVRALAHEHAQIFASVGVHPNERDGREPTVEELIALGRDEQVVAVGETGLDYFRNQGDMRWQQERFRRHMDAARALNLPLVVHTRESAADTLTMLHDGGARDIGGVMHCFTEDWDTATRALDLGFHISFSGIVTFKNADALREVARKVPLDRMLIETDAPYLAPVPHRGQTNEPAFVRHVAECLAGLRGLPLEEIAERTTGNFYRLFHRACRPQAGQ